QLATNELISQLIKSSSLDDFTKANYNPPLPPSSLPTFTVKFSHSQLFIGGRYTKLQRHISNSEWIVGAYKLTPESVEEYIAPVLKQTLAADDYKFACAGREDADVLCLGEGRPFYVECVNPKVLEWDAASLETLQRKINEAASGRVAVGRLAVVSREDVKALNASAATKAKSYSCIVRLDKPIISGDLERISDLKELEIEQKNPTRVPRRADLIRKKTIHSLSCTPISVADTKAYLLSTGTFNKPEPTALRPNKRQRHNKDEQLDEKPGRPDVDLNLEGINDENLLKLELRTSAGTYVKEFVHGDDGRTNPCLKTLLGVSKAEVLCLDVNGVHFEWPPAGEAYGKGSSGNADVLSS
ncbi:putative tRNA pseudouridine synthase Pus10, partial [Nowakowskiella sp. JEL0078]